MARRSSTVVILSSSCVATVQILASEARSSRPLDEIVRDSVGSGQNFTDGLQSAVFGLDMPFCHEPVPNRFSLVLEICSANSVSEYKSRNAT